MGTAAKKKRPMRSRRSGVKKLTLVKSNLDILKKLAALFIVLFFIGCAEPYHIIETYTTDSTGKTVKTIQKYYSNTTVAPQASVNIGTSFWWNAPYYPYYRPVIVPRVVVPSRPVYVPRGSYHFRH